MDSPAVLRKYSSKKWYHTMKLRERDKMIDTLELLKGYLGD